MVVSKRSVFKSYLLITIGTLIMAAGTNFFMFPNNYSVGGVTALSIILTAFFPSFTAGEYMIVINISLLVLALLVFGRKFATRTIYSSILLSVSTRVLEMALPMPEPFTNQKFLELVFAIGLKAIGSAIIFNEAASSGGMDIIAMILKKYMKINIGGAILYTNLILAISSIFAFGFETGLYSILGLLLNVFFVDNFIDSMNLSKCFLIVTEQCDEICSFINHDLHMGATVSPCTGAFSNNDKKIVITVLKRSQAVDFRKIIKTIDPHAFSVAINSSDILGKGFRYLE